MIQFGAALKKAREDAGISIEEIFETTRISMKHLLAIEAGDFPSVPQTYVRAFIREYARVVSLDEDRILETYNAIAERDRGIPQPPKAIDNSNILPHPDESIEILKPGSVTPRHVEVQGKAEVQDQPVFTPPIRRSPLVPDNAEHIEIRTTLQPRTEPSGNPPEAPSVQIPTGEPPTAPSVPVDPREKARPAASREEKQKALNEVFSKMISPASDDQTPQRAHQARKSVYELKPPLPADKPGSVPPRVPPTPQVEHGDDVAEQRRILLIGSIIVVIIAVGIYGAFFFNSHDRAVSEEVLDSAGVQASLDAGKFIDSAQHLMTELPPAPTDTARIVSPRERVIDATPKTVAREDSLVLEAVTTAPVWFSIRMDTTRTERGNLSSNDHRFWKARDRFVITLGDAGAVTFFLNGKEIGTLGEDGAVVKNLTLSRQNLSSGQ